MNLVFKINKPIHLVFDYLSDMQKFVSVHPIITKIDRIAGDNYLVYETLKFGFIPFSFTYRVTVKGNPLENTVIISAVVMKLTQIYMTFVLKSEGELTIIEENIQVKSPLPIKSMMQYIFKKQHTQLFKNIERLAK